jgi:hypothetical protein
MSLAWVLSFEVCISRSWFLTVWTCFARSFSLSSQLNALAHASLPLFIVPHLLVVLGIQLVLLLGNPLLNQVIHLYRQLSHVICERYS